MTDESAYTTTSGNSFMSQVTIEDIEATLRKFPKPTEPLPDWRVVDSPYMPKESLTWIPPTDPFVVYDESDHGWLKKLGFGTYEMRPVRYLINMREVNRCLSMQPSEPWSSPPEMMREKPISYGFRFP